MKVRPVIKGLCTFIPGVCCLLPKAKAGHNRSAIHCYERWIKHLTLLHNNGMTTTPKCVAELGPGDSLGVGLAAILCGAETYYALDVVEFADPIKDLNMLDELIALFRSKAGRPKVGWPNYDQFLDDQLFPSDILTDKLLEKTLHEKRIDQIRDALLDQRNVKNTIKINYIVPWNYDYKLIPENSIDLLLSHTVLQHVSLLEEVYKSMALWVKKGGFISHQIDFCSMNMSEKWNGHWACSDFLWKLINGKRPYLINRQPCSAHIELIEKFNFEVTCLLKNYRQDGIDRSKLAQKWKGIKTDDMNCCGAFIQASKL